MDDWSAFAQSLRGLRGPGAPTQWHPPRPSPAACQYAPYGHSRQTELRPERPLRR